MSKFLKVDGVQFSQREVWAKQTPGILKLEKVLLHIAVNAEEKGWGCERIQATFLLFLPWWTQTFCIHYWSVSTLVQFCCPLQAPKGFSTLENGKKGVLESWRKNSYKFQEICLKLENSCGSSVGLITQWEKLDGEGSCFWRNLSVI